MGEQCCHFWVPDHWGECGFLFLVSLSRMQRTGWMWLSGHADEVDTPRETVFEAIGGQRATDPTTIRTDGLDMGSLMLPCAA